MHIVLQASCLIAILAGYNTIGCPQAELQAPAVIPAKAGIQNRNAGQVDSCFRRNDEMHGNQIPVVVQASCLQILLGLRPAECLHDSHLPRIVP